MDTLDGVVGEGVEDVIDGVEHQFHIRVVGTVVVDGEVDECRGHCRENVGMRLHDARGWLSVPPVAIGAAGYQCCRVLREVVV